MYTCTICGQKKKELGDQLKRRHFNMDNKMYLDGVSDWCSKCAALRFFFKSEQTEEALQQLDEQPQTRQQQNCCQAPNPSLYPTRHNVTRGQSTAANKILQQEIIATLQSHLPHASIWERHMRSQSTDNKRRNRPAPDTQQRSKSVVSGGSPRSRAGRQSELERCPKMRNVTKLDALKPNKDVRLDVKDNTAGGQRNDLGEQTDQAAQTEEAANQLKATTAKEKAQQLELIERWQQEAEKIAQQYLNNVDASPCGRNEPAGIIYRRIHDETAAACMALSVEQTEKDMEQIRQQEVNGHLRHQLHDLEHIMKQWHDIRLRADSECERVATKLHDLKYQMGLESGRVGIGNLSRQRGGAHVTLPGNEIENGDATTEKTEKPAGDALDEKILGTVQEETTPPVGESAVKDDKMHVEAGMLPDDNSSNSLQIQIQVGIKDKEGATKITRRQHISHRNVEHLVDQLNVIMSTVQRAQCRIIPEDSQQLSTTKQMTHRYTSLAQFSTVPCSFTDLVHLVQQKPYLLTPTMVRPIKICLSPIICPDSNCHGIYFISDFNEHLRSEHILMAVERITPRRPKTFLLDPKSTALNESKCHAVYFVKDRVVDDGHNRPNGLLPILLMSARVRITEILDQEQQFDDYSSTAEVIIIWLTSVKPEYMDIVGTISVWPLLKTPKIEHLNVHTSEIYNIRASQDLNDIFDSDCVMILPYSYIAGFGGGKDNLLAVQVQIY